MDLVNLELDLEFCKVAISAVKIGKKEMDLANFRLAQME
jgi:hypothetical protein